MRSPVLYRAAQYMGSMHERVIGARKQCACVVSEVCVANGKPGSPAQHQGRRESKQPVAAHF